MIEQSLKVMPAIAEADLVTHLAGVWPMSAGRTPIIGPVPGVRGVILATGHGRSSHSRHRGDGRGARFPWPQPRWGPGAGFLACPLRAAKPGSGDSAQVNV